MPAVSRTLVTVHKYVQKFYKKIWRERVLVISGYKLILNVVVWGG